MERESHRKQSRRKRCDPDVILLNPAQAILGRRPDCCIAKQPDEATGIRANIF